MKDRLLKLLPVITGLIASLIAFVPLYSIVVLEKDQVKVVERVPGQDNLPPGGRKSYSSVKIGEFSETFISSFSTELKGSWPSFRGEKGDNICRDSIRLIDKFAEQGPPVLWRKELGEGHAAPAIHSGRVYLLDYIEEKKSDALRCFSLLDGKEIWRRFYRIDIKRNHGYSRTIPAVNEDVAVTMGPMGHVMAVNSQTGELLWTLDVVSHFISSVPQWYSGQCPLLDGNTLVIAPGGEKALLAGFNAKTGEILWQTSNEMGWKMSHSSVMPMTLNGTKMYVYAAVGGMAGVAADGENIGKILWKTGDWGATVVAPSPVIIDGGYIYQCAGYGAGSIMVKIDGNNGKFSARIVQRSTPKEALAIEQQSAIYFKQRLFGIMSKDSGSRRMRLVACNPENPRDFVDEGDPQLRFGLGPLMVADNRVFALDDSGNLSMFNFENDRLKLVSHAKILPGVDAWGPMAIADGLLLLRDSTSLVCLDMTSDYRWAGKESK